MLPISLDLARLRVLLVGEGAAACRRLALLDEAGARALDVFAPEPVVELAELAGARLRRRWPHPGEVVEAHLLFVADAPEPVADDIGRVAQAAGILVNVEDDRRRSDFHSAAVIRRGDLCVAVSTNGKSPGLAAQMRRWLDRRIGPEWGLRLDEIAALRRVWRATDPDPTALGRRTREWAAQRGWPDPGPPASSQPASRPIP
jgi:precorrin-2 dehydrogenase/sirohydrochlorin ferrochelatase